MLLDELGKELAVLHGLQPEVRHALHTSWGTLDILGASYDLLSLSVQALVDSLVLQFECLQFLLVLLVLFFVFLLQPIGIRDVPYRVNNNSTRFLPGISEWRSQR